MPPRKSQISVSAISGALMLLAILAIIVFQGYWLHKNYQDELENLHIRTNVLFSETAQACQIEKLKLDSNFKIRLPAHEPGMNAAYQSFRLPDSVARKQRAGSVIVSLNKTFRTFRDDDSVRGGRVDSLHIVRPPDGIVKMGRPNLRVLQFLQGLENPKDSVTVKEVSDRYAKALEQENIYIAFAVSRGPAEPLDERMPPDFGTDHIITLGFNYAYSLSLELQNTIPYVLKKLIPQILVSLLLVGLTIFSFVLMYRNMRRQRKLTRLKNDFISNITHELKTPIATVSVAIEALRNFNALHDPQRTEEYLDISANELQRLSLLVDKVLKLSMFEKQQIELKSENFDLKELVEEVVASMRLQLEKYKASVNIQLQGEDFMILADRMHITSVVFNLLDNALKYSKAHPAIQIDLVSLPNFVEMSITDNGIGISTEHQKKIFDKFFRVPTGDTHNVKGYGLGLSYVAYIMDRHKGMIHVESQPGIGTRFITKLPKTA